MKASQAASLIGCTTQHVRTLIRSGRLKARKVPTDLVPTGYCYDLDDSDVRRYANEPQARGFPRGGSRK